MLLVVEECESHVEALGVDSMDVLLTFDSWLEL